MSVLFSFLVTLCALLLTDPAEAFNVCLINVDGFAACTLGESSAPVYGSCDLCLQAQCLQALLDVTSLFLLVVLVIHVK